MRRSEPLRLVLINIGVAVLYVAAAKLGLALAVRAEQVSAVWPPTGFALAAVVLLGRRALPGIFLGAFAANATAGEPLWVAAGIAAGNALEAFAGAAILARSSFDAALARLRDVRSLIVAVALAPCVSATIGVFFLVAGGLHPIGAAPALWPVWWLGDALGGLIVAPLILVWSRTDLRLPKRGPAEPALMLGGVVLTAGVVFSRPPNFPAEYLVYPFLIWAALRLGPAYTTTAALLANGIAVAGTLGGYGPFAGAGPEGGFVLMQCFMAVGATTALILAAVTAQARRAHERADTSEQQLRMAMAGARVGVWSWNIATGEIVWSEGLEPLHGLPRGGFAGTYEAWRRSIHPEDLGRVEASIAKSVETREPYQAEFRLVGSDGVTRWTAARGIVLGDAEGRASRMVGVGIDVTELKQLEEELRLQHRRKDEFLAMLGHELRNPLAAVGHAVELLSSDDPAELDEARRVIRRQTSALSRLVDDLLDLSRITRGRIPLQRRQLPLAEAVAAGIDVWRHLVTRKRQQLTVEGPAPVWVDGDPARLAQVVANLVHNAAKFTPEGGAIRIAFTREDDSAVLRVRDDGMGMRPEVLPHAFDLFVQDAQPLDRHQGGLGLGLTLVRSLVEMHGGTVEARSEGPGRGTEVIVRLPAVPPPPDAPPSAARAASPGAKPPARRVLVVEDNDDTRNLLVVLLRHEGHDVRSAGDGPAALAAVETFIPEIVLLDLGLPGLDGYSVARELRASSRTANALLVALTGYGQPEDRQRAFDAGFDHHLLKPVEPARMREILRQAGRS